MSINKKQMIIFGFIVWPVIIAAVQVTNAYILGLATLELSYGEIPKGMLALGLCAGLFGAVFFIGISYFISFIIKKIKPDTTIHGSYIFFLVTCLFLLLFIANYSITIIQALQLEQADVEYMQQRIREVQDLE